MKKIMLGLLFLSTFMYSQDNEIKITSKGIESAVINVEGKSAEQIYRLAKDLILATYSDPKIIIKVDETGKILRYSGFKKFKGGIGSEGIYDYTCQLEFKDGRYKISFEDVYLDKGIKRTYVDLFNKEGQLRKMEFYKTLHSNFTTLVNEVNQMFKEKIVNGNPSETW